MKSNKQLDTIWKILGIGISVFAIAAYTRVVVKETQSLLKSR